MPAMRVTWDLFCNVVDNYGDIGVAWRLAHRQFILPVEGLLRRMQLRVDALQCEPEPFLLCTQSFNLLLQRPSLLGCGIVSSSGNIALPRPCPPTVIGPWAGRAQRVGRRRQFHWVKLQTWAARGSLCHRGGCAVGGLGNVLRGSGGRGHGQRPGFGEHARDCGRPGRRGR